MFDLLVYVSEYWGTVTVTSKMTSPYLARLIFKTLRVFCIMTLSERDKDENRTKQEMLFNYKSKS